MSVVGRAYVSVRAVTRQVGGDIDRAFDKALGDIDAKAKGGELGDAFMEGAGESASKSDHVHKGIDKNLDDYDSDRAGNNVGRALGQAIGEALAEPDPFERALTKVWRNLGDDAERDGQGVGDRFNKGIGKGISGLATSPLAALGTIALPALADAIKLVSQASAAAVAVVGTLGPALAAAGAVGASSMLALVTSIGTVTAALKTQSDELDHFKAALRPVRDEFSGMGQAVQRELLPALSEAASRATTALGPTLRRGLVQTGESIGYVAKQFASLTEQASFQQNLAATFRTNAAAIRDFGDAGVQAADGMIAITSAAGPLTRRFSGWVSQVTESANASLQAAEASGQLTEWLNKAGDMAAKWGSVFGNVGRAIGGTFSAGMEEGQQLLDMLDRATERWDNWTHSIEGQEALNDWFERSSEVMSAAGDALGGLIKGFQNWAGTTDETIATLEMLSNVFPTLGNVLHDLSAGARSILIGIQPIVAELDELSPHIMSIADALGNFAGMASNVLGPAIRGVATVLDILPDKIVGVVGAVALMRIAFGRMAGSEGMMGRFATGVTTRLGDVRKEMSNTVGAAGKFRKGMSGAMGALGGPWGLAIGAAVVGLGMFAQKQAETKARVDELASSLDKQTGAVTENTRELQAANLEQQGALALAEKLGVNLDLVTEAALGNKDAMAQLQDELSKYAEGVTVVGGRAANVSAGMGQQAILASQLSGIVSGLADDTRKAAAEQDRLARASATATAAEAQQARVSEIMARNGIVANGVLMGGARNADHYGGKMRTLAGGTRAADRAVRQITRATIAYHKATSQAMRGNIGLEQSIDDAAKEMRQGARGFNINTQAGRDNKLALIQIADAAAGVTGNANKQAKALERGRNQIIKMAESQGLSSKRAENLANKLISVDESVRNIPKEASTEIKTPGMAEAQSGVRTYKEQLDKIPSEKHTYIYEHHLKKEGRAGGGWIIGAGTTTSDSIPYGNAMVSNREFVVNARDAARNAALLEAINSGQQVGAGRVSTSAPTARGAGEVNYYYNVTVVNPHAERTSDSIPRALRRARDLGISGGDNG